MSQRRFVSARKICRLELMARAALLVFALCILQLSTARAQSTAATLSGTVIDQNGAAVPNVAITVLNTATSLQREVTSNEQGNFTVPLLSPGTYQVRARRDGFASLEVPSLVLNVGDQKALQIQLKAGDVNATVQVTDEAELVRTDAAVATVVDRQFVGNIPLNGRSLQSLITLTPGVVATPGTSSLTGEISVNGQRTYSNSFTVDGVSANTGTGAQFTSGPQTGGNIPVTSALGTTQSLVSVDALEEFKIQTSGYAAEYGRQPGGQISISTRSGTNRFHGSLFDYVRNDKLDANNWFANRAGLARPPERQNDFGGTLSGPLMLPRFGEGGHQPGYNGRNRTFFFFSYEGLRLRLPTFQLTNVPTLALRKVAPPSLQPLLNSFPLSSGKDLGNGLAEVTASYSNPASLNATSIRLDHVVSKSLTLFGRFSDVPSHRSVRDVSNSSVIITNGNQLRTVTVGATVLLGPQLADEFRLNRSNSEAYTIYGQDHFGGAVPVGSSEIIPPRADNTPLFWFGALFFDGATELPGTSVSPNGTFHSRELQWNVVDSLTYTAGSHRLKFGFDYRHITVGLGGAPHQMQILFFSQDDVLNSVAPFVFLANSALRRVKPVYTNFSAYAQDSWKLSARLTLDLGVRWDVNPAPIEANGNFPLAVTQVQNLATMQLASPGTPIWNTTFNNFAPRLGIAYAASRRPGRELVLRGGAGVFYDTGNNEGAGWISNYNLNSQAFVSFTFPLTSAQVAPPPLPATITPPYGDMRIYDPHLKLPYTWQWNVALEQSLGKNQTISASYVGAASRRLLQTRKVTLAAINPLFTTGKLIGNSATSDYDALQTQFQRRLARGLQALVSYTWSHAIDEDSSGRQDFAPQRGNADFDIRHNFASALTYDIPKPENQSLFSAVLKGWSVDGIVHAMSAPPVDLTRSSFFDPVDGSLIQIRPNLIFGVPLYVKDPTVPGGRRINRAAFSIPASGTQGSLGRNVLRGFANWQMDVALRRQFSLSEGVKLQLRGEAFNLFNHPNFGAIQTSLTASNFGQATNILSQQLRGINQLYQIGGPRSMQLALKVLF